MPSLLVPHPFFFFFFFFLVFFPLYMKTHVVTSAYAVKDDCRSSTHRCLFFFECRCFSFSFLYYCFCFCCPALCFLPLPPARPSKRSRGRGGWKMFGRRRREGDCERDEAERCWGVADVHLSSATYSFIYFRKKKKRKKRGGLWGKRRGLK
uniref:Putative Kazal-type serpin n=1 Tax=Trypanosoma cruzi TaxID=5693 RepID=Q95WT0_TRYCR|nr:putative Kazal-type serpin [Trypanosoma cruzi]